jgi:hypothetical protein
MNKNLMLVSFLVLGVMLVGFASATAETLPTCTVDYTTVAGTVSQNGAVVEGAAVTGVCTHNEVKYNSLPSEPSESDGGYSISFAGTPCTFGDSVNVTATKDGLSGEKIDSISQTSSYNAGCCVINFNLGIADVIIVPEFGVFAGALTLLSAVGIFFFVRRK